MLPLFKRQIAVQRPISLPPSTRSSRDCQSLQDWQNRNNNPSMPQLVNQKRDQRHNASNCTLWAQEKSSRRLLVFASKMPSYSSNRPLSVQFFTNGEVTPLSLGRTKTSSVLPETSIPTQCWSFISSHLVLRLTEANSCLHDTGSEAPGNCSSFNVGSVATRC
jgi:hypothetical protein